MWADKNCLVTPQYLYLKGQKYHYALVRRRPPVLSQVIKPVFCLQFTPLTVVTQFVTSCVSSVHQFYSSLWNACLGAVYCSSCLGRWHEVFSICSLLWSWKRASEIRVVSLCLRAASVLSRSRHSDWCRTRVVMTSPSLSVVFELSTTGF